MKKSNILANLRNEICSKNFKFPLKIPSPIVLPKQNSFGVCFLAPTESLNEGLKKMKCLELMIKKQVKDVNFSIKSEKV